MKMNRRSLLGTAAACLAAGTTPFAHAQGAWPARPIRLISPYGAGGASDISARILAEDLGKRLGQQIVVENKPGAGTRLANEYAARQPGDGYTILYAAAPYATAEALYGKQPFDTRKDLQPVALVAMAPLFLIVNAQTGIKSAQELVAFGKSKPSGLNIASPGAGSQPNLASELFLRDSGSKGVVIHFRGDAPSYSELLAGRVDATLTAITTALPHIQAGKLRVLGVAATQRSALYPDAPTLREQGFPSVVASGWYGFMVPGTTPKPIVDKLQVTVIRALADPEIKKKFLAQGLEPNSKTSSEFRQFIDDEGRKWGDLIAKAGIKAE